MRISTSDVQRGHAAAVQADGSVIVAGRVASCSRVAVNTLVYRLTSAGQPDPTFAGDAVVDSQAISAVDVALQPDGKAVVLVDSFVGVATSPAHDDAFTVVRYDTAGHADPGFGTGGVALALFGSGSNATPRAVALQGDRIVAVGGLADDSAVARFTPGGIPDGSFAATGCWWPTWAASTSSPRPPSNRMPRSSPPAGPAPTWPSSASVPSAPPARSRRPPSPRPRP